MDSIIARRTEIVASLDGKEEQAGAVYPSMAARYQKEVTGLIQALNRQETRREAADFLRGLIDKIVLRPKESGKEYTIDLHGDLAGIPTVTPSKSKKIGKDDPMIRQVDSMIEVDNNHLNQGSDQFQNPSIAAEFNRFGLWAVTTLSGLRRKRLVPKAALLADLPQDRESSQTKTLAGKIKKGRPFRDDPFVFW